MASWKVVRTFLYRSEAEIARNLLRSEDMEVQLRVNEGGNLYPQLNFVFGVDLLVREEDEEEARRLLEV